MHRAACGNRICRSAPVALCQFVAEDVATGPVSAAAVASGAVTVSSLSIVR
jgi:hypothetical protein